MWKRYIEDGYKKGAGRAFDDTKGPNTNIVIRARDAAELAKARKAVEEMLKRVRAKLTA